MSKPFIRPSDKTGHRGVVLEGAPASEAGGVRIARVGDKVFCPYHDDAVIATGDPTCVCVGQLAVRHGDTTSCSTTLIASQLVTSD